MWFAIVVFGAALVPGLLALPSLLGGHPSAAVSPSASVPVPSPTPKSTLPGETPSPSASAPANARYIPGLAIGRVFDAAMGAGFICQSLAGEVPDNPTMFELVCTADDEAGGLTYVLTSAYWTADRVNELHLSAHYLGQPTDFRASLDVFTAVLGLPWKGSIREEAVAWLVARLREPGCSPCFAVFGSAQVEVQTPQIQGPGSVTIIGATTP